MATEKWEVDLRNQLNGVKPRYVKEKWEVDLLKDIGATKTPKKSSFLNIVILICLVVLVGFVYNNKTGYFTDLINKADLGSTFSVSEGATPEKVEKPKKEQPKADPVQVLRADFEKMKAETNKKFESLDESVKWGNDRLTLITAVNQDNFLTVRKGSKDFIYINGDWKIDRLPQNLKLTEEDLEFLNKFYKK